MRYRNSLHQNKKIVGSVYNRKKTGLDVLPTSNHADDSKSHGTGKRRHNVMIALCITAVACTITLTKNNIINFPAGSGRRAQVVSDPNSIKFSLLISYPDSQAEYVSDAVEIASESTTAVNHAYESEENHYSSIFGSNLGPYMKFNTLPQDHVLTSTNCGDWDECYDNCAPSTYLTTSAEKFEKECFETKIVSNGVELANGSLSQYATKRIVHAMINPFTNVVSRYFNHVRNGVTEQSPAGFKSWCARLDGLFTEEERRLLPADVYDLFSDVPCHAEFYRYIQWHNAAFELIRELGITNYVINIEDFLEDYESSLNRLLEFMQVSKLSDNIVTHPASFNQEEFFTSQERVAVIKMVKQLSNEDTWDYVKYYFPEVDGEMDNHATEIVDNALNDNTSPDLESAPVEAVESNVVVEAPVAESVSVIENKIQTQPEQKETNEKKHEITPPAVEPVPNIPNMDIVSTTEESTVENEIEPVSPSDETINAQIPTEISLPVLSESTQEDSLTKINIAPNTANEEESSLAHNEHQTFYFNPKEDMNKMEDIKGMASNLEDALSSVSNTLESRKDDVEKHSMGSDVLTKYANAVAEQSQYLSSNVHMKQAVYEPATTNKTPEFSVAAVNAFHEAYVKSQESKPQPVAIPVVAEIASTQVLDTTPTVEATPTIDASIETLQLPFAPVSTESGVRLALLLGYPLDSSNYIPELIQLSSKTTTASNYAGDSMSKSSNTPVYSGTNGPYVTNNELPLPSHYILTKSSCKKPCESCGPSEYIESIETFMNECFKTTGEGDETSQYSSDLVSKTVHVVTNPVRSIISYYEKNIVGSEYQNDDEDFQTWCREEDIKFMSDDRNTLSPHYFLISKHVPCHGSFYRFAQWFNFAFEVAEKELKSDPFVVHMEDFKETLGATTAELLTYLELSASGNTVPFEMEDIKEFFTKSQLNAISVLLEELSSETTWKYLQRYFPEPTETTSINSSGATDIKPVYSTDLKVAWLLTFPSSGTTYTSKLIRVASQTTSATNYGNEYVSSSGESIPIYRDAYGPYVFDENYPLPEKYIITKTHCGSRCQDCAPTDYFETVDTFMAKCLRAPRVKNSGDLNAVEIANGVTQSLEFVSYEPELVKKVVHVVKDPLDNIVSRFHHEYKSLVQKFDSKDKFPYSYDKDGFQQWCKDVDGHFTMEEKDKYPSHLWELAQGVPCHGDFYRYVQWHNLAFETAQKINVEPHVIKYEDYGDKLNETVSSVLQYLELPMIGELLPFKWDDAHDHFTSEQILAISAFIKELASEKSWTHMRKYFDDLPANSVEHLEVVEEQTEPDKSHEVAPVPSVVAVPVSESLNHESSLLSSDSTKPRVAWLLSFPSSGTTYTSELVRSATQTTTGTNYGNEYVNSEGESVPLYDNTVGPYIVNETLAIPSKYLLTKTHCGSRCQDCSPKEYIETAETFLEKCLRAPRVKKNGDGQVVQIAVGVTQTLEFVSYDPSLVKKVVHIMKNPFDNVVSRFHHEYKSLVQKFASKDKFPFEYNKEGFRKWCEITDGNFVDEEKEAYDKISDKLFSLSEKVPCHADFFRYVQWHNLSFEVADRIGVTTHVLNSEGFKDDLQGNLKLLLEYIEEPQRGPGLPFGFRDAKDHFTDEERSYAVLFMKEIASQQTWSHIKKYFPTEESSSNAEGVN